LTKGGRVFALVGKSGTGKSFRAKLIAEKYDIELIIDDGLLIRENKIIAGKSAKKEKAFLGAIRTALFEDPSHRAEVRSTLQQQKFKRILVIGTSERMVNKITKALHLPEPTKILYIEDIATKDEIELALNSRHVEGSHVIPVPALEVSRDYSRIFYDSVKLFLRRKFFFSKKPKIIEKTVVRPRFSKRGRVTISEAALTQMVLHCADEFDHSINIRRVLIKENNRGYSLDLSIHVPYGTQFAEMLHNFKEYVIESLERHTGILIEEVNLNIDRVTTV
jgi:uncharacterized alkaline shock family protein YloU